MDPQNPESFNHKTARLATGRIYHFVDQLPEGYDTRRNPTLLCVHGFPDLWFGFRYQIGPWVRRGWRVVVPDMLGYGGSDKPPDASEYSTKKLCSDLASLLDFLGVDRAIVVGHDWGAFTAARFALWYPGRLFALAIISVPYTPPSRTYMPLEDIAKLAPNLSYQLDFAKPETSSLIDLNLGRFLQVAFRPPGSGERYVIPNALRGLLESKDEISTSLLNDAEFAYYHAEFEKGMNGPLNYYRTTKYRYDEEQAANLTPNLPDSLPVLFIWGAKDTTTVPRAITSMRKSVNNLQEVVYEHCGHWVLIEAKDEVAEKVANWIANSVSMSDLQGKL